MLDLICRLSQQDTLVLQSRDGWELSALRPTLVMVLVLK